MLAAVEFERQTRGDTVEVDDVTRNWMLPAKAEVVELVLSKAVPEVLFRIRRFAAHCSCEML